MTGREEGLLMAAKEARERADGNVTAASAHARAGNHVLERRLLAEAGVLMDFAVWCEMKADAPIGTGRTFTPAA